MTERFRYCCGQSVLFEVEAKGHDAVVDCAKLVFPLRWFVHEKDLPVASMATDVVLDCPRYQYDGSAATFPLSILSDQYHLFWHRGVT